MAPTTSPDDQTRVHASDHPARRRRATPPRRRTGFAWMRNVAVRLFVIALVPTLGLAGFAQDETFGRRSAAQDAARIQEQVGELAEVVALRFQVSLAEIPALALTYGPRLGMSVDQVSEILGVDLQQVLAETTEEVRRLVANHPDDPDFRATGVRMDALMAALGTPEAPDDLYGEFSGMLRRLDARTNALASSIRGMLHDDEAVTVLRAAIRQLLAVHDLAHTGGRQLMALFDTQLPQMGFGNGELFDSVAVATGAYVTLTTTFESELFGGTNHAWKSFQADPDVRMFDRIVGEVIDGSAPPLLEDLDRTAEVVRSSIARNTAFSSLVSSAGVDVAEAAAQVRSDALESFRTSAVILLVVAVLSIMIVYFVGRSISRPLQRLARYAASVSDGDVYATRPTGGGGPTEVRTVGAAFDDVVDNLQAIDAHALALATGDLEDPMLAVAVPGPLGESLQASVAQLSQSIAAREELQLRLTHEATHDGLTGVPNRAAAMFALESAIARNLRRGTALAVLLVDLDDFKRTNDTLGQGVGDEVLRETSLRLRELARTEDTVARLGGDEFLVIAESVGTIHDAVGIAERIVEAISVPMQVAGRTVEIGASVGLALSVDGHAKSDALVREADLAVYRAKMAGRRRVEVFDTAMRAEVAQRSQMEERLTEAIRLDQLTIAYQPVVSSGGLFVSGFEALVRWRAPDGTPIPPDAFIPIAETSDLIIDLDRWVIRNATAELAKWASHGLPEHLQLAVNVSGRHLVDRRIVDDVAAALRDSGLSPTRLVLEITETVLLSDMPVACDHLEQLRALGVTIAIDDFGSGYTSLATLRNLPVDVLKIDRSLVAELGPDKGQSLVRLIIEAAHEFGMGVIAEGVETDEQRSLLEGLGCEEVQGWLVSPAVPAEQARSLAVTLAR